MQRTTLDIKVDQGESFDLVVTLKDTKGATIDASAVLTLTLTLYDQITRKIINSRNNQDIQNANGATIADKVVTVRLDASDNVLVGTVDEWHIARVKFTWNDGTTTRTGIGETRFKVCKLPVAVAFAS